MEIWEGEWDLALILSCSSSLNLESSKRLGNLE